MSKIYLKFDIVDGDIISCDYGNAWIMLFLGPLYPFYKKDYKMFLLILFLQLSLDILFIFVLANYLKIAIICCLGMTFLINLLFALNYNMIVIESLLKKGYVPYNYDSCDKLLKKGIYFKLK